jgi:hypothetical protein
MRTLIALCVALVAASVPAADTKVYQTDRYGNVQYHQPSLVVKSDGRVQQVDPYGHVQSHKPGLQVQASPVRSADSTSPQRAVPDATIYATDAYGRRQQPTHVVQNGKVYETDRYGNRKEQVYVIQGDTVYQTDRFGNRKQPAYKVVTPAPVKK